MEQETLKDIGFDIAQDRRDGYRPGVMIALRLRRSREIMLGRQRGSWTWMLSVINDYPHDADDPKGKKRWMYSWSVPQGGIEEGETCEQAIRRELAEELGPLWCEQIIGDPKFLFKERATFLVEKDGKVYKGKALYAFLVEIDGIPDDYFDWMYGDGFSTLPVPEFQGGIQFYDVREARAMIHSTQRGPKGAQLMRLLELAQA